MDDPLEDLGDTLPFAKGGKGDPDSGGYAVAALVFLEGPNAGLSFPLEGDRIVVGRREGSDLVIPSLSVSKEHCAIVSNGPTFSIEDLGSTNGVLINGARVASGAARQLFHGDNVRIADSLALFRQAGCFKDETGGSRIKVDMDQVRREADSLLHEFGLGPK